MNDSTAKHKKYYWAFGLIVCSQLFAVGACAKKSGGDEIVLLRYIEKNQRNVNEIESLNYQSYVIGQVFFGMYIRATDQGRYSGRPPFSVNLGAFSLTKDVSKITIVSAELFVNDNAGTDILNHFAVLSTDTKTSLSRSSCGDCGHYGSRWLKTDYFISSSPANRDKLKIIFQLQVDDNPVREVVFYFVPEVRKVKKRGLPA